jgi:hypothetical protein
VFFTYILIFIDYFLFSEAVINELSEEELEDWDYAKISGLGFIDAMCVPHFDKSGTNGNARSDDAEKILLANPTTPAIGVDENAALVVVGNDAYAVSGDGEATCHVVVPDEQNAGETFTAPLPTDWEEPIPMEELLEFATPATGEHLEALEDHVDTDFVIADDVVDIVEKAMANQQRKGRKSVDVPIVKLVAAGSGAALQLVRWRMRLLRYPVPNFRTFSTLAQHPLIGQTSIT